MGYIRTAVLAATAILIGAVLASTAWGVVACGGTGEAVETGDGQFEYCITISWDFEGLAVPERFDVILAELDQCEYYVPGNPLHEEYLIPGTGLSDAATGCTGAQGEPTTQIEWVGEIRLQDPDCWVPSLHVAFENTGSTKACLPLTSGSGQFCFRSFGTPLPAETYYDVILVKAGDVCLTCDYTGPLPDCNYWSPVESLSWGTIKALYR